MKLKYRCIECGMEFEVGKGRSCNPICHPNRIPERIQNIKIVPPKPKLSGRGNDTEMNILDKFYFDIKGLEPRLGELIRDSSPDTWINASRHPFVDIRQNATYAILLKMILESGQPQDVNLFLNQLGAELEQMENVLEVYSLLDELKDGFQSQEINVEKTMRKAEINIVVSLRFL